MIPTVGEAVLLIPESLTMIIDLIRKVPIIRMIPVGGHQVMQLLVLGMMKTTLVNSLMIQTEGEEVEPTQINSLTIPTQAEEVGPTQIKSLTIPTQGEGVEPTQIDPLAILMEGEVVGSTQVNPLTI